MNDGVGVIDTGGYGADGTIASYVVKGEKASALIDVGYSLTWGRTKEGLQELGVASDSVERIFLTHVHLDHAGATWDAVNYFPNAKLTVHEKAVRHLIDPSRLVNATRAGFEEQAVHVGEMKSIQPERIEPAREEKYDLGRRSLQPVFTPGHMPGHMSLYSDDGILFSGDAVCVRKDGLGLLPAGSPPIYDVKTAVESVDRLKELRPKTIFAPHFGQYPPPAGELELHSQTILDWRDRISSMVDEGLSFHQIKNSMHEGMLQRAGTKPPDLDDYTSHVLMDKLLGMTVEGYMGYLLAGKM